MDINQVARMIEWLDEERRRDKNMIVRLEEQLAQQQEYLETVTRRFNALEGDVTVTRNSILPAIRESEMFDQVRSDVQQMVEAIETRRLSAERESEKRSDIQRESLNKLIREITERIDELNGVTDDIGALRVERDRFGSAISALQQRIEDVAKKLEEPDRRLAFLEEQRRQDARRLSEVQSELPELQRGIDGGKAKQELVEEMSLRNEKKLIELQNSERDRREQIQQFVEQQTLYMQQRDARMNEMAQNFTQYDEEMRRNLDRFETWSETYRQMKRALEDFERIGERLERRINEVAETQRLSEERFRQEWNGWNSDDQKRWKQFTLTNDEAWRLHDRDYEQFRTKFNDLLAQFPAVYEQIERLWRMQRAYAEMYRDHYQAILSEHDQPADKLQSGSNGRR